MTAPTVGIKDLLVAAGNGVHNASSGWSIHIGREPTKPHSTITIYDSGGETPNPAWLLDFPSVQVRVRGDPGGYVAAQQKMTDCKNTLLGLPSQDLNGDRWVSVRQIGGINLIGYDESNRPMFTMNISLIIEPAVSGDENRIPL